MMKKRLGDILLARGVLDPLQLASALAFQRRWGVPLGQVVVDQRFCGQRQVLEALAEQTGLEAVDLDAEPLHLALAPLVSQKVAEAHRVVPLRLEGPRESVLVVALAAPGSMAALDAVKSVSGKGRVVARLATDAAIQRALGRLYRGETAEHQQPMALRAPHGFALPEAEEELPLMVQCMAEETGVYGRFATQAGEQPARVGRLSGLPLLAPLLVDEAPTRKLPQVTPPYVTRPRPAAVLVYGWGAEAASGLLKVLQGAGQSAKVASTEEVLAAGEGVVVLAPLPSLEALGSRPSARLLVAAKVPELDLPRAQALGARGILAAPVDPDLMLRAVRRLLGAAQAPLQRVG